MANDRRLVSALSAITGFLLSSPGATVVQAENTSYFIDSEQGKDTADGHSEATAWKTLARVNTMTFGPGDKLLFKAGGRWTGQLSLKGSGTESRVIRVGRYGRGMAPHIAGEGRRESAVVLQNGSHWLIEDLDVTHTIPGGKRRDFMSGVKVDANAGGIFKNITLRRLHVHHVSGGWDRQGGCGILAQASGNMEDGSGLKSRYDGLLIEDCYIHDVSFYGIMVSGWENRFRDKRWFPSTDVVVRNNFTRDTGGDSIVVTSCDKPLIENNEGHRAGIGQFNGGKTHAAGMWPHSSDGTVMRYNKVVGIDAKKDGQAFDVDINCRNTLIEYNWSQRNKSGFLLMCSPNDEVPGTSGIVVRNNVSIDDGEYIGVFKLVPNVKAVRVENNAIFNSSKEDRGLMHCWKPEWEKVWTLDIMFRNNIFSTPGKFVSTPDDFVEATFRNNTYSGAFQGMSAGKNGNVRVKHPAARIVNGMVMPTHRRSSFKPFDISKAGLLPTSSWIKQRDQSLRRSLNSGGGT